MAQDDAIKPPTGLSVTALYTAHTWSWGGLPDAELFVSDDSKRVFDGTNFALSVAKPFMSNEVRSLRHSLIHRHTMIDHLARASGAKQIVELAAGLSRRGVTMSADPSMTYVEIDLPDVVHYKRALMQRSEAGREVLVRPNLHLVRGDVLECDLGDHVDASAPLFVIAEGLVVYLKPEQQETLFRRVRELLSRGGGAFVFDLVPRIEEPRPGATGRALEWLMKRFTSGRSFEKDLRTREDIAAAFGATGFAVEVIEPGDVAEAWGLPFADVPTRVVLFFGRAQDRR